MYLPLPCLSLAGKLSRAFLIAQQMEHEFIACFLSSANGEIPLSILLVIECLLALTPVPGAWELLVLASNCLLQSFKKKNYDFYVSI